MLPPLSPRTQQRAREASRLVRDHTPATVRGLDRRQRLLDSIVQARVHAQRLLVVVQELGAQVLVTRIGGLEPEAALDQPARAMAGPRPQLLRRRRRQAPQALAAVQRGGEVIRS